MKEAQLVNVFRLDKSSCGSSSIVVCREHHLRHALGSIPVVVYLVNLALVVDVDATHSWFQTCHDFGFVRIVGSPGQVVKHVHPTIVCAPDTLNIMDDSQETGPVSPHSKKGLFAFHLGKGRGVDPDNVISDKAGTFLDSLVPIRDGSCSPRLCEIAVDVAILLLGCVVKSHDCNVGDFDKKA
jgi:hypothetical protein